MLISFQPRGFYSVPSRGLMTQALAYALEVLGMLYAVGGTYVAVLYRLHVFKWTLQHHLYLVGTL